jgi:serine/threonine protein phosphatase PrpC
VLCPSFTRDDAAFLAVFDGTVGPDASHYCQQVLLYYCMKSCHVMSCHVMSCPVIMLIHDSQELPAH